MNTGTKGFTLIELLVVIAIIGLLSSVILASLSAARAKGQDATIKSSLSGMRTQAGLYYDAANGSFAGVCANTTTNGVKTPYTMMVAAAEAAGLAGFTRDGVGDSVTAVCNDASTGWAAQVPLTQTPNTWFCVDSAGAAGIYTSSRITTTGDRSC